MRYFIESSISSTVLLHKEKTVSYTDCCQFVLVFFFWWSACPSIEWLLVHVVMNVTPIFRKKICNSAPDIERKIIRVNKLFAWSVFTM